MTTPVTIQGTLWAANPAISAMIAPTPTKDKLIIHLVFMISPPNVDYTTKIGGVKINLPYYIVLKYYRYTGYTSIYSKGRQRGTEGERIELYGWY